MKKDPIIYGDPTRPEGKKPDPTQLVKFLTRPTPSWNAWHGGFKPLHINPEESLVKILLPMGCHHFFIPSEHPVGSGMFPQDSLIKKFSTSVSIEVMTLNNAMTPFLHESQSAVSF